MMKVPFENNLSPIIFIGVVVYLMYLITSAQACS